MKRSLHSVGLLLGVLALAHLPACSFGGAEEAPSAELAVAEGEGEVAAEVPVGAEADLPAPSDAAAEATAEGSDPSSSDPAVGEIPPELLGAVPGAEGSPMGGDTSMGSDAGTAGAEGGLAGMTGEMGPEGSDPNASFTMPEAAPETASTEMPSAPPTDAMPSPPPAMAPSGDAQVYYVTGSGVALKDKPDPSGQVVAQLTQGDPVLVKIEGSWANIVNRGWVEASSLSMTPVGRNKPSKNWN